MIVSPMGQMSVVARTYLASVVVAMLVLLAAHFSIQASGQQQARQWVAAWEKQHGGHVGLVRLQMLRGALSIRDLSWQSPDATRRFSADLVLLRGNVSASMEDIDVREVVVHDSHVLIPKQLMQQAVLGHRATWLPWGDIFSHAKRVDIHELDFQLDAQDDGSSSLQAIILHHGHFSQRPEQQSWQLSGQLWHGEVSLQSHDDAVQVKYHGINAARVMQELGLSTLEGQLSGNMSISKGDVSAQMVWHGGQPQSEGRLAIQGSINRQQWQLKAQHWPVQVFAEQLPDIYGEQLSSGYLQGSLDIKRKRQAWMIEVDKGQLSELVYGVQHVKQMAFQQAQINLAEKRVAVAKVSMQQGQWLIDLSNQSPSPEQHSWQLDVAKASFDSMRVADKAEKLWLPDTQGAFSLQQGRLHLQAESDSEVMGQWQIKAQGLLAGEGKQAVQLDILAQHVPLVRFRDFLPAYITQHARLSGDINLSLSGQWQRRAWQVHGDARGEDMMWNRATWLWRAKHVAAQNLQFGSAIKPSIDVLEVYDWAAQASLSPWTQAWQNSASAEEVGQVFTLDGWQLSKLRMDYGKFSLGQADAVWFEADKVLLDHIGNQHDIGITMKGLLADGAFDFRGTWHPWGTAPWISLQASLRDALPFVAAPWFQVSGLPMITRGRISADMTVKQVAGKAHHYLGMAHLRLKHGQLQNGVFSNQLFTDYTSYDVRALFDRINNDDIRLDIPLQGNWVYTPLSGALLGKGLLDALTAKAATSRPLEGEREVAGLSNIRLHDSSSDSLKHNERVRLRKVMRTLWKHPGWVIELQPQLGQEVLDDDLRRRVRNTQRQIEAFLEARAIKASRIYPVWPQDHHRQGQLTGILIQAVK